MRTSFAVLTILLLAPISGIVSGDAVPELDLEIGEENILPTYSRAVQLAFARVSDMDQYSIETLKSTNDWLIVTQVSIEKQFLLKSAPEEIRIAPILRGAFIWTFDAPLDAISSLEESVLRGEIESFSPMIEKQQTPRSAPNDENFTQQWHLENTGQTWGTVGEDANVTGVWDYFTGTGITISVVDDGLDKDHPDISPNYSPTHSYDWCNNDADPSPSSWNGHGTAAGGVAAAAGDNTIHVAGAAYDATIAGSTLIACWAGDATEANALSYHQNDIDIYTNSWGPSDNGQTLEAPGPLTLAAMEDDVYNGRNGYGNIITWAAGNGLDNNDNVNYDGYASSRYAIAVAAITHYGEQSYYSEPGASILIAAHSNGDGEGITTTDIHDDPNNSSDDAGYDNGNVTHTFGGTSSATPLAAGVIALILDANENLTWRDIQHVLVQSARKNDASDSSWGINGANHDVSHKYGFGAIDAGAAVALAQNWTNVDEEINSTFGPYSPATTIPSNSASWTEFTTSVTDDMQIESVDVIVDIDHPSRGNLEIVLVSPDGTESWLAEEHSDSNSDYSNWMFNTVQHWDEGALGTWTLKVRDDTAGTAGTLNSWEMILHGIDIDLDHDNDGLSDENETNVYGTDPYNADTDNDGLNDYDEIVIYGTNATMPDTDLDGLSDSIEISVYSTDPLDSDSDDDGLSDGVEVNYWSSDPLVYDADSDGDLFYHFDDCDDNNPDINPGKPEKLNNYDDNCDDYIDEGFNFTDRDNDGLRDWPEYHIHGTDYQDSDTDNDGLSDGEEVNTYAAVGANPLIVDADADGDGWYWFQDCADNDEYRAPGLPEILDGIDNDCDFIIDEDFWSIDTDNDGLFDYDEYHNFSTNPNDGDTDDDGLPDGSEINTYADLGADPLVPDADDDSDGWYWFQDCDDNDNERSPSIAEMLDGKDNDCNDEIDETFHDTDHDTDGLSDYDEFHLYNTDYMTEDSDEDGLTDGDEVIVRGSNPNSYNYDKDEDTFYDYEDCQDLVPEINPAANEIWNGWDDDCNDLVDDNLERINLVYTSPQYGLPSAWDAVNETLVIGINGIPSQIETQITWTINGYNLQNNLSSEDSRIDILVLDCDRQIDELTAILCSNGSSPQTIQAVMIDSGITTTFSWDIQMDIWIPPQTFSEKILGLLTSSFGLAFILVALLTILGITGAGILRLKHKRELKNAYSAYNITPQSGALPAEHRRYELPSAPDISAMIHSKDETIVPPPPLDLPLPPPSTPDDTPTISARTPDTEDVSEIVELSSRPATEDDDEIVELIDLPARVVDDSDEN